jgi:WD40 repeat protein
MQEHTTAVALGADATMLVSGRDDGSAIAFRPGVDASSAPLATLAGGRSRVNACACAANGLTLLGGADGSLRLWNPLGGALLLDIVAHPFPIVDCDISHDGSLLVSASSDGALRVWDARGTMRHHIAAHGAEITACRIGSLEDAVLSCSRDETVKLWSLRTGRCVETFFGASPFESLAVAANQPLAAVVDARGAVTLLEVVQAARGAEA